uniref:Uncharacterized protein n=1 Tax=Solanum tuberosum TaxID=4113 RepID=M1BDR3_SOLTU
MREFKIFIVRVPTNALKCHNLLIHNKSGGIFFLKLQGNISTKEHIQLYQSAKECVVQSSEGHESSVHGVVICQTNEVDSRV